MSDFIAQFQKVMTFHDHILDEFPNYRGERSLVGADLKIRVPRKRDIAVNPLLPRVVEEGLRPKDVLAELEAEPTLRSKAADFVVTALVRRLYKEKRPWGVEAACCQLRAWQHDASLRAIERSLTLTRIILETELPPDRDEAEKLGLHPIWLEHRRWETLLIREQLLLAVDD